MNKFLSFFLLSVLLVVIGGCARQYPTEPVNSPGNTSGILLKVNNTILPDSSGMENRTPIIFVLQASFPVKSWTTTFGDDGSQVNGDIVQHTFRSGITSVTVKVVAVDNSNVPHQKIYKITLVANMSIPSVVWIGKRDLGDGTWEETFLFLKEVMQDYSGPYGYIGNNTNPTWILNRFIDTNKIFTNGTVIDPPTGQKGTYLMVKFINSPNPYDMGVGRIVDTVASTFTWVPFDGPYADGTHIKYSVAVNGDVTPGGQIVNTQLPGDVGDTGPLAVTRFGVRDSTKLTIYVNNFTPWVSSNFIVLQNADGILLQPVLQTAASGFNNFGKLEILAVNIPANGKYVYNYGYSITPTLTFNSNAKNSGYFNQTAGMLKVIIQKVGLGKRTASGARQYWVVTPSN